MKKFFYVRRSEKNPQFFMILLGFTDPEGEDQFSGNLMCSGNTLVEQIKALSKEGYIARA